MLGTSIATEPSRRREQSDTHYGFTWVVVDGQHRLRTPDGQFKEVEQIVVETLKDRASDLTIEELIADVEEQNPGSADVLREMYEEEFIRDGDPIVRLDPPTDISLWPQALLVLLLLCVGGAFWVETARLYGGPVLDDPLEYAPAAVLVAMPLVLLTLAIHEYGHYWVASKQGLDPTFGVSVVNGLFPVLITRTTGGWALPRNRRILITLAGPVVGLAVAILLFALHYTVLPYFGLAFAAFGCYNMQLVSLFPLLHGDGYYLLTDLLGEDNLKKRGLADLQNRDLSGPLAYVVVSYAVVLGFMIGNVVVAYVLGDYQGAIGALLFISVGAMLRLRE